MKLKRDHTPAGAKLPFNMIEIVIALAIILVVVTGMMGLIPSSVKAGKDAINRSNAADAADQFLHYMASRVAQNWDEQQAFPSEKPAGDDEELVFSSQSLISAAKVEIYFETPNEMAAWDPSVHTTGIFKVIHITQANATDFRGVLRAWKELTVYGAGDAQPTSATLHAEVSWPATKPYASRTKATYELEVFKTGTMVSEETQEYNDECVGTGPITGNVEVTPTNNTKAEFFMVLADGTKITRDDLLELGSDYEYQGIITYACFRPKGNDNDLNVGGEDYELGNETYVTGADRMLVHLYNDGEGTSMGQWQLDIISSTNDAYIDDCKTCGD